MREARAHDDLAPLFVQIARIPQSATHCQELRDIIKLLKAVTVRRERFMRFGERHDKLLIAPFYTGSCSPREGDFVRPKYWNFSKYVTLSSATIRQYQRTASQTSFSELQGIMQQEVLATA